MTHFDLFLYTLVVDTLSGSVDIAKELQPVERLLIGRKVYKFLICKFSVIQGNYESDS